MSRVRNFWKRRVHEIKTQKNNCLWGKIDLKAIKWNECFKEKTWSQFEWKTQIKRNWTLKAFTKILKRKERNWKLTKYWKNQIRESFLKLKH
jgi:hypothetical protein